MESTLVGLVISAVIPKLLELLKSRRWAPFINHYSPWVNRTTAIAIAFVTAIGVTVDFDAAAGVLTVGGLLPEHILRLGLTWILNFATQEAIYRRFINTPSSAPPDARRGGIYLIPILLALGMSATACASAGKVLVEADRGIHATLAGLDDTVNRACDAKLRSAAECKAFNGALANAFAAHQRYNAAAQEGSMAGVPAMVSALAELRDAVTDMAPQAQSLIDDVRRWHDALKNLLPKETR